MNKIHLLGILVLLGFVTPELMPWDLDSPPSVSSSENLNPGVDESNGSRFTNTLADRLANANSRSYGANSNVVINAARVENMSDVNLPGLEDYFRSLDVEAEALEESGIRVTEIAVYPDGTNQRQDGENLVVTSRISVARKMEHLPIWEERLFIESLFDATTGNFISLEVHDQQWYATHPNSYEEDTSLPLSETNSTLALTESQAETQTQSIALSGTEKALAVEYANKWWDARNPSYVDLGDTDCTNFVSQALYAGGWSRRGLAGAPDNRADSSYWWYDWSQPTYKRSHSWADSQKWKEFAVETGRVVAITTANARTGDVIQYDIGDNGMNHTTIVTFYDYDTNQPLLTYHSSDNHNVPLSVFKTRVAREAGLNSYRLYAWRT